MTHHRTILPKPRPRLSVAMQLDPGYTSKYEHPIHEETTGLYGIPCSFGVSYPLFSTSLDRPGSLRLASHRPGPDSEVI